jgi:excisionase family DNA binding protein
LLPPLAKENDVKAAPTTTAPAALNLEQAAAYLGGLSTSYVRRLVAEGKLTAARVGSRVVFPVAHLDAYLDANLTTVPKPAPRRVARKRAVA